MHLGSDRYLSCCKEAVINSPGWTVYSLSLGAGYYLCLFRHLLQHLLMTRAKKEVRLTAPEVTNPKKW